MSIEGWLLFVATETVLCLSPGPAVLLVLSVSLTKRFPSGLKVSAGILVANALYFLLSATSLVAILLASWEVFFLIKWIGAAYLILLGIRMCVVRSPSHTRQAVHRTLPNTSSRAFLQGFVAQGANPKALVYFTAILPQFVNPDAPLVPQITILAITSIFIEFGVLAGYAVLASRASHFAERPWSINPLNRIGGGLLIGAGAGLATLKRT